VRVAESVVDLIGGTPLVRLGRLFPDAEVIGKLEALNPGGSVKDRPALAMVEAARASGALPAGGTLVEATSGNTGVGLAVVAAVLGYRLILTMPETANPERVDLLRYLGAEIHLTPGIEGMSGAVFAAEEIARREGAFYVRQFENEANPEVHRRTTAEEIWRDLDGALDVLVAGVGTGGTLTGTAAVLKERLPSLQVVAVEPRTANVLSGGRPGPTRIHGLGAGFCPGVLRTELIDRVVAVADEDALLMALRAARQEGLMVGVSAGAALVAAEEVARQHPGRRIVVILPDSGERYLSMFRELWT
jgi:cysteine synthase A